VHEPPFLSDHSAPYPLRYATLRMLAGVCAFPLCRDRDTREALVRYVGHVAADCSRHAEEAGLLVQSDIYDLVAEALLLEPADGPISTDRAGVYHAILELDGDDALQRVGPLLALLRQTA
jgi:hypothetical protein